MQTCCAANMKPANDAHCLNSKALGDSAGAVPLSPHDFHFPTGTEGLRPL